MVAESTNLNITPMMPQEGQTRGGEHGEVEARQGVWRKEASLLRGESEEGGHRRMSVACK